MVLKYAYVVNHSVYVYNNDLESLRLLIERRSVGVRVELCRILIATL